MDELKFGVWIWIGRSGLEMVFAGGVEGGVWSSELDLKFVVVLADEIPPQQRTREFGTSGIVCSCG